MKYRTSVKKMCSECKTSKRDGKVIVRCKKNPRHNQTQG